MKAVKKGLIKGAVIPEDAMIARRDERIKKMLGGAVIPEDAMIARRDERIKKMLGGTKKVMKGGALTYDQVVLISALTGVSVAAIYTLLQGNNQVAPQPDVPISQISIPHLFGQADPQLDNLEAGGRYIQPINHKPSEKYCCGAGTPPNMMYRPF